MRVKGGARARARHNKILELTKGYRGRRSKLIKVAKEAAMHAGDYAFRGRKERKRQMRSLWIVRINGALKEHDLSYSAFIKALKDSKIELDRKILANLVMENPNTFKEVVKEIKKYTV